MQDYYSILEVAPEATYEEIQRAYKRLMLLWHPDRVPANDRAQAEEKSKLINEARTVLIDTEKRAIYDRARAVGLDDRNYRDLFEYCDVKINLTDGVRTFGFLASLFHQMANGVDVIPEPEIHAVKFRVGKPFYDEKTIKFLVSLAGGLNIMNYEVKDNLLSKEVSFNTLNMSSAEHLSSILRRIPTLRFID